MKQNKLEKVYSSYSIQIEKPGAANLINHKDKKTNVDFTILNYDFSKVDNPR